MSRPDSIQTPRCTAYEFACGCMEGYGRDPEGGHRWAVSLYYQHGAYISIRSPHHPAGRALEARRTLAEARKVARRLASEEAAR